MSGTRHVECLQDELWEYAAGRLAADRALVWERHLAVCDRCCAAVAQERRLRAALASAPSMPGDLRSSLMSLGSSAACRPTPPMLGADPIRVLHPLAPPMHRSPLRATMIAVAAVGVSAAAAWSLGVSGAAVRGGLSGAATPSQNAATPAGSSTTPTGGTATLVAWITPATPTRERGARVFRVTTSEQAESTP